jgi:hypothetical protein
VAFTLQLPRVSLQSYGGTSLLQQHLVGLLAAAAKVPATYVLVASLVSSPNTTASLTVGTLTAAVESSVAALPPTLGSDG